MRFYCFECGVSCTSELPEKSILRAYILCPECQEMIPEGIANLFFRHAERAGKKRIKEGATTGTLHEGRDQNV